MSNRPRVVLLIAAHCPPKVLKVTLGSWLQYYDGSYDVDVYVGLHKNYHHYNLGLEEIREMADSLNLVYVDELDWMGESDLVRWIMRFSKMHARSLQEMMGVASKKDFTHAVILDHDLIFKDDFIGWVVKENPKADMACSMFGDRLVDELVTTNTGHKFIFAPKPSAWHILVSRKMFDLLVCCPKLVEPGFENDKIYDTLSLAYHHALGLGMPVEVYPEAEMLKHVEHVWAMSMNYGVSEVGCDNYKAKLARIEREYAERFPNGMAELLKKLEKREGVV